MCVCVSVCEFVKSASHGHSLVDKGSVVCVLSISSICGELQFEEAPLRERL